MGEEAPEFHINGCDRYCESKVEPKGYQTRTIHHEKIYVVGEPNTELASPLNVKIFDKLTNTWLIPIVFGAKPDPSHGHFAIHLKEGRILIIRMHALLDDAIWFLEVGTPFVEKQKAILGHEVVAWSKGVKGFGPKPIVITGPSGVGKGTLIAKLMDEFPLNFGFSVSHTTRAPREKEKDGVHYHFTERSIMEKEMSEGKFLETALVHGNLYGTSVRSVEAVADAGKRCILDIDVQGARSVRASSLDAVFIFIRPPSFEELEKRLRSRGTETEEHIQKRLRNARAELEQGKSPGLFDHTVVNDNLETCYERLKEILDLDVHTSSACQGSMKDFSVSACQSIWVRDEKIVVPCQTNEEIPSTIMFALDYSTLKDGAPGPTRGVDIRPTH